MEEIKPITFKKPLKKWWRKKKTPFLIVISFIVGLFLITSPISPANLTRIFDPYGGLQLDRGRINVLLLGIPGKGHDGPNLTDTIMVVSIDPEKKSADLISLPRDLWIEKYAVKVNALYHLGVTKGTGLELVKEEIGRVLGIKIPYGARMDFSGFTKAVDLVEGINIDVQNSFEDYFYPVPGKERELCDLEEKEIEISEEQVKAMGASSNKIKALMQKDGKVATVAAQPKNEFEFTDKEVFKLFPCRFEHLSFEKGLTQMNGETALKFVRSRHGTGNEGSDFARSRRQQLVLSSFKDNILTVNTLTDPQKIVGMIKTFGESVEVDIPVSEYPNFIKFARGIKLIRSFVVDPSVKPPLLIAPPAYLYGGAFVLIPPDNNFELIHRYIEKIISGSLEATPSSERRVE